ncbi:MAG TPA: hypothetical protein VG755_23695, partial [Nannocystaceae bacterium]|nr:hypothetical protein [Nannocystaceae bacterium]
MQRIVACLPLLSACTIITSPTQPSGDVVTDGSESSTSTADTTTDAHDESTSGQVSSGDESSSTPADESSDGGETESSADETGTTPPGEILFAADFDDVRFPEYGFSSERVTAGHSMRTAVPSAGPH